MVQPDNIVIAGAGGAVLNDRALLREIRGSVWDRIEPRFFIIMILSLAMHSTIVYVLRRVKLRPVEMVRIENIPERFARLIIEKPIEKTPPQQARQDIGTKADEAAGEGEKADAAPSEQKKIERAVAQKNVAARVARVEKKIRTVGVLGILTGVGGTARGPAVVDVLGGGGGSRKEHIQDLEVALEMTSGLKKTGSVDVLNKTLVRTKEVDIGHRESIDDLLADVNKATTHDLVKKGDFIIKPPESIEGAASSNAKRDDKAIGSVVRKNKTSIKLTYEKYLKRDPALAGKVTIRFTISAAGTVSDVTVLENTTKSAALEQEIIRKIRMWQFDAISEGDVTVTYPFLFQPS